MTRAEHYADRLYTQAITDPTVDALNRQDVARYIRAEAEKLCLDWRTILKATGSLHPTGVEFQSARTLAEDEDYLIRSRP